MGWFDNQIRQRKQSDQDRFEDSILRMASVVVGNRYGDSLADDRIITKHAIDDILKYYHCKPVDIPESLKEPEEQLEYALRPYGLMYRVVELKENWFKDGFGPVIAFREEDGVPIALFPKELVGYYFRDSNGKKITVNKKNMKEFGRDAICFYRPLPLRSIGIPDLLLFLKNCVNIGDLIIVFGFNLLSTLVGLLMPGITKIMAGFVRPRRQTHRVPGNIQAPALGLGMGRAELAQIPALAAAHVQQRFCAGEQLAHRRGDGGVKARGQEAAAGVELVVCIPGVQGALLLHRQQVDITLPGDVVAVAGFAAPGPFIQFQRQTAERAEQIHGGLLEGWK